MARALPSPGRVRLLPLDRRALLLAVAHALLLAAFFLPWIEGSFGERSGLSGLEVAALSPERSSNALLALVGPYAWLLYLLPALAVDGLLLALLGDRLGFAGPARRISLALALPGAVATGLVLAFLATEGALLDTLGHAPFGLVLLLVASACTGGALVEASRTLLRRT